MSREIKNLPESSQNEYHSVNHDLDSDKKIFFFKINNLNLDDEKRIHIYLKKL